MHSRSEPTDPFPTLQLGLEGKNCHQQGQGSHACIQGGSEACNRLRSQPCTPATHNVPSSKPVLRQTSILKSCYKTGVLIDLVPHGTAKHECTSLLLAAPDITSDAVRFSTVQAGCLGITLPCLLSWRWFNYCRKRLQKCTENELILGEGFFNNRSSLSMPLLIPQLKNINTKFKESFQLYYFLSFWKSQLCGGKRSEPWVEKHAVWVGLSMGPSQAAQRCPMTSHQALNHNFPSSSAGLDWDSDLVQPLWRGQWSSVAHLLINSRILEDFVFYIACWHWGWPSHQTTCQAEHPGALLLHQQQVQLGDVIFNIHFQLKII